MDNTKLKNRMSGKVQELQNPAPAGEAAGAEASLVSVTPGYIALTNNAVDLIRDNLKHQPLSLDLFDIVKSSSWTTPPPGPIGTRPTRWRAPRPSA